MASRRVKRQRRLAFLNIAIVILAIAGVAYAVYRLQPQPFDELTLCPVSDEIPAHTALLLDKTDNYSRGQADRIAALVRRTADDLDVGERFTLFELDERGRMDPDGAFSRCNPGQGGQVNPLYNNPRQVQERYEEAFGEPLDAIMATLIAPREAPQSPVVEAIARLAQTDAFSDQSPRRRVIVISDMLQNSDTFSIYGGDPGTLPLGMAGPEAVAAAISNAFPRADLRGVDVEVRLIPRTRFEDLQRGALRDYWETLFDELGMDLRWRDL